jgi:protein phosphatase
MKIQAAGATHVGRVRAQNQDAYIVCLGASSDRGLFVVADGLGGHAGGEVASRMAVEAMRRAYPFQQGDVEGAGIERVLREAIRNAHQDIRRAAEEDPNLHGMGTTLVAVAVQDSTAFVANVGDSRAYRVQDGEIRRLTRDHTVLEERIRSGLLMPETAYLSVNRHILSRALGCEETVEADINAMALEGGDLLILCSDGLTNMLDDEEILGTVSPGPKDPLDIPGILIGRANDRGGVDNITVVIVKAMEV